MAKCNFWRFPVYVTTSTFFAILNILCQKANSDPIRIDCGYKNAIRTGEWEGDIYFEGGETHVVTGTQPAAIANTELKTLRTFPVNGTGSPCYSVPVNASRYLIRMGFLYGNYDRIGKPPSFLILLNQVTVHTINFLDDSEDNAVPYYTEYILYAKKAITICLKSLTGAPLVNSIEIFPQDIRSYNAIQLGTNVTLRTVFRLNAGGPSINGSADVFHRIWTGDLNVDSNRSVQVTPLLTVTPTKSLGASISGTIVGTGESSPPDYLPTKVFHSARVGLASSPVIQFKFSVSQVNPLHSWFLRLLFTEIDYTTKVGERVFDVFLSAGNESQIIKNYDVLADSGVTAASNKTFQFGLQNAGSNVEFSFGCRMANSSRKPPLLSGFELLSVIPSYLDPDFFTFPPPPPLPPPIDDSASLPPPPPVSTQGTHNSNSGKNGGFPNIIIPIILGTLAAVLVVLLIIGVLYQIRRLQRSGEESVPVISNRRNVLEGLQLTSSSKYRKSQEGHFNDPNDWSSDTSEWR